LREVQSGATAIEGTYWLWPGCLGMMGAQSRRLSCYLDTLAWWLGLRRRQLVTGDRRNSGRRHLGAVQPPTLW
jgi:hypothetical protein